MGTPTLVSGQVGQALLLGYNKAYLDFGSHTSTCLTDLQLCDGGLTISMWIYFLGVQTLFPLLTTGGDIKINTSLKPGIAEYIIDLDGVFSSGRKVIRFQNNVVIAMNTWYHFTFVCEHADNALFYLNAENIPQTKSWAIGYSSPPGNFYIGTHHTGGYSLYGEHAYIDDIRIFNRILSASEVQQIYDATK